MRRILSLSQRRIPPTNQPTNEPTYNLHTEAYVVWLGSSNGRTLDTRTTRVYIHTVRASAAAATAAQVSLSGMLSEEKSMAIKRGNLLVEPAVAAAAAVGSGRPSITAGTNRFLARLSGRRRHVRKTSGGTPAAGNEVEVEVAKDEEEEEDEGDDDEEEEEEEEEGERRAACCGSNGTLVHQEQRGSRGEDAERGRNTRTTTLTNSTSLKPRHDVRDDRDACNETNASFSSRTRGVTCRIPTYVATFVLIVSYSLFGIADACSSRSTPKPRPPTPTPRPNITFHMYKCPDDYAQWYCLNGATCFTVKIADSVLYNCLCANGYVGERCEFKDLDGSYLPSRQRVMLETASIAGGATIAVFLVVIICIATYIHCKRKQKELRTSSNCVDTVDGPGRDPELRPFSNHGRSLRIFMAKNSNHINGSPSIEQTKMPEWNYCSTESTRMASISEGKRSNNQ
ncbi:uncharacterized protein LOC124185999 isoform X1 [Neodiprion fabricii]|uniref:uncharacterized protein LOC124185999 isoform X1 n=2 Tax=Neodiprion fabricii TaxID=2872261 RepID=UPI001ED97C9C|nr:uncharacterized protein LOC124185999 isoform X1 [Neodiprion fabricii]